MPIPQNDIDHIAERVDIVEIVGEYVQLKQRGRRFWGLSPFNSEKTPSFCVDAERGFYYCFSTNQGGNVFNFLMKVDSLTFPEAVDVLAKRYNIPYQKGANADADDSVQSDRRTLLELYARVTDSFHYLLLNNSEALAARQYLSSRYIDANTIEAFKLGYCLASDKWLWGFLMRKGYTSDLLKNSGLFQTNRSGRSLFSGRIVFPITNHANEVIGFGARAPHDNARPKYINSPETIIFKKRNVFFGNIHKVKQRMRSSKDEQSRRLYLVEGYTDALALYQLGVVNAVATLGTAFSTEQAQMIKRITNSVVLLFDADSAGRDAAFRAGYMLQQMEIDVYVCRLPHGADPGELLRTNESFRKDCRQFLTQYTKDILQYVLDCEFPKGKLESGVQSDASLRRVFEYVALTSSSLRREQHLKQLADHLNVDRENVLHDFEAWHSGRYKSRKSNNEADRITHIATENASLRMHVRNSADYFEIKCMAISIGCIGEFSYLRSIINQQCLVSKLARYLYNLQEHAFQQGVEDSQKVVQEIEHAWLRDYVVQIIVKHDSLDCKKAIVDIAHRLKKRYLYRLREQNIALLRSLDRDTALDNRKVQDVQLEIMYLNKEILKQ